MARKGGGYQLLASDIVNSDHDDDENVLFDSGMNAGDGWSDGEEQLNIFAESSQKNLSPKMETIELRSRNGAGSKPSLLDEGPGSPSSSQSGSGRSKNSNTSSSNNNGIVLLERRVRKDDTLQKISLQFSISVAELKRVNGFIADTDLFARDIIKIPVRKYGYNHALVMAELGGDSSASTSVAGSSTTTGAVPSTIPTLVNAPVKAENLLQAVDANVQKAQRQLEQRQQSREVFNADNGFDDEHMLDPRFSHGGRNIHSRNSHVWLERSVRHFLVIVLIIFVLVGLPVIIYILYQYHNYHPGDSSTRTHSPHHH